MLYLHSLSGHLWGKFLPGVSVTVVPVGQFGESVGMLSSCKPLSPDNGNSPSSLYEVVAISESTMNGHEAYNLIWIEWENGIAYRKGAGRVLKSVWLAGESDCIDLILG
jgi:hypothetical protein